MRDKINGNISRLRTQFKVKEDTYMADGTLTEKEKKSIESFEKFIAPIEERSKEYDSQIEKTDARIKELLDNCRNIYEKIQATNVKIYVFSVDALDKGANGRNELQFYEKDKSNVKITSPFGINTTVIKLRNIPLYGQNTFSVFLHEMGHAFYHIEYTQFYYNWLQTNKSSYGHGEGDPSGEAAKVFNCN